MSYRVRELESLVAGCLETIKRLGRCPASARSAK